MAEVWILVLVFVAVALSIWVAVPMLVEVGLWRAERAATAPGGRGGNSPYGGTDPKRLMQSCWVAALLAGGICLTVIIATGVLPFAGAIVAATLMALVGYRIPRMLLKRRLAQRQLRFEARLMDLTLGLANGLRSGASLPQSLELVARDIGGPVGEEFGVALQEYRLGVDLTEALTRLCKRMPSEDLTLLMSAVRLTMQAGGSLADVMDKITITIRDRTEFQEKLRTMTAQGRFEAIAMAAAPLVAFLVLFWIDPNLMRPLVQTRAGWCALGVVAVLETIGFLIIDRIVTIKV